VHLFSYWHGPITWAERLSINTALGQGNTLTLFSPTAVEHRRAGLGVEVIDAREVLDDDGAHTYAATFADQFRLVGLEKQLGTWVDLDLIHVRPLPEQPYLYGFYRPLSVGNSVLRLPSDSPALREYSAICGTRPLSLHLPWESWPARLHKNIKHLLIELTGVSPPLGPRLGPPALTHLLKKHDLTQHALPQDVFFPFASAEVTRENITNPGWIEGKITPRTCTVHLWKSCWNGVFGAAMPQVPWLLELVKEYDISESEAAE